jgi:hypothetical protein
MNKDISKNKVEHFENTSSFYTKMILISVVSVIVIVVITHYAEKWYKNRQQNAISNTGIVETTQPGIASQFFKTPTTSQTLIQNGGKRKLKKNKISSDGDNNLSFILIIFGILILSYILYRLYIELQMLKELEEKEDINKNRIIDNRDTIKIAIPKLVGSINAGQYMTTRYGYFVSNP